MCSKLVHLDVVFNQRHPRVLPLHLLLNPWVAEVPQDSNRLSLFPSSGQRHGSLKPVLRFLRWGAWLGGGLPQHVLSCLPLPPPFINQRLVIVVPQERRVSLDR